MILDAGKVKKCRGLLVFKLNKQFKDGRGLVEDNAYCGCPDLGPMDFRVFPEIKSELGRERFNCKKDLVTETMKILCQDRQFYINTNDKWISRHRKCITTGGDYVEKVKLCQQNDVKTLKWRYVVRRVARGYAFQSAVTFNSDVIFSYNFLHM